jgi:PhoPQ-activated pathogenicity-related protein
MLTLALLVAVPCLAWAAPEVPAPPTDLVDYVTKKDDSFSWKLADAQKSDAGTVYEIDLVSQTWHDIKWDHKLQVFVPRDAKPQATMVLWNQGGTPNLLSGAMGLKIAERVKAPVAFLFGVPKQPLFEGKKEDALIAETFVQYLETKDGTWPLLFPMVKSVVRAMDALQQFAKKEWDYEVKSFVVTGASKRGWTAWLTGATGDNRVKAIAPIVIDTLNLPLQMKNQVNAFGKPSEMIKDYTARKLIPMPDTPEAQKLWKMVDPWVYREKLTMPKLIINGANDPYWPLDALNSYWDDLKGDKWVLYVPNAGHDLRELGKDGKRELLPMRAIDTLSAFARCMIFDKPMPKVSWKYSESGGDGGVKVEVSAEGTATSQRFWTAEADTRDFRKSFWKDNGSGGSKPGTFAYGIKQPAEGDRAGFVETEFELDGLKFNLSTQLRILEAKKK